MFMLESGNPDNTEFEQSKCNSTSMMTSLWHVSWLRYFLMFPIYVRYMVAAFDFVIM